MAATLAANGLSWFFEVELVIIGRFSILANVSNTVIAYLALTWIAWLVTRAGAEAIAQSGSRQEESLDSNMVRLIGRVLGIFLAVVVLASGANELGLPVFSVLAGLGIGGLAIALAIRPTLENLIGGFLLYIDRPIRVGDCCSFGEKSGTVEKISVRST